MINDYELVYKGKESKESILKNTPIAKLKVINEFYGHTLTKHIEKRMDK